MKRKKKRQNKPSKRDWIELTPSICVSPEIYKQLQEDQLNAERNKEITVRQKYQRKAYESGGKTNLRSRRRDR